MCTQQKLYIKFSPICGSSGYYGGAVYQDFTELSMASPAIITLSGMKPEVQQHKINIDALPALTIWVALLKNAIVVKIYQY